jgi:hypothetical protein
MTDNDEKKVVSLSGARETKDKQKDKDESKEQKKEEKKEIVHCSFCDRPNHMVIKMIQGPEGVNICSECTMICVQYFMLSDRVPSSEARKILDAFWNISRNS